MTAQTAQGDARVIVGLVVIAGLSAMMAWGSCDPQHAGPLRQTTRLVASAPSPSCSAEPAPAPRLLARKLSIVNVGKETTVSVAFGSDSVVGPSSFPCQTSGPLTCSFPVGAKETVDLPVPAYLNATFAFSASVGCGTTKAEVNLSNPKWYDTADVSLVDGFSVPVMIEMVDKTFGVWRAADNEKAFGVFPLGCDVCVARKVPSCGQAVGSKGCKTGSQYDPSVPCQYQGSTFGGQGPVKIIVGAVPA